MPEDFSNIYWEIAIWKYVYTSARTQRIAFIKLGKWSSDSSLPHSVSKDGLERQHMKENATTVNKASVSSWYCGHTASLYNRQTPDLDVFLQWFVKSWKLTAIQRPGWLTDGLEEMHNTGNVIKGVISKLKKKKDTQFLFGISFSCF